MSESNSDESTDRGDGNLREALVRAAVAIGDVLEREPELRAALAAVVGAWRGLPETASKATPAPSEAPAKATEGTSVESGENPEAVPADAATREELQELVESFSGPRSESDGTEAPRAAPTGPAKPKVSVRIIAERCRLKQRACVLAAELDEHLEGGQVVVPHDDFQPLINQAKALPDCYLWMLRPEARGWIAAESWEQLGRNFENLARALALADALVEDSEQNEEEVRQALTLAAEAQRAVRQAVVPCVPPGRSFEDSDQLAAYRWVAHQCETLRIYVARYMRVDDPADPANWADLRSRITDFENLRSERTEAARARNKLFGKVRYEAQRLLDATPEECQQRIAKIAAASDELLVGGVKPSDVRLRELLLPVYEILEDADDQIDHEGFQLVLREMDRFLAARDRAERAAENRAGTDAPSPEVERVRAWLAGREVVVVGGEERPEVVERLRRDFGLSALTWVATRPHESTEVFRAPIQRPEVAAVLLAIRWSSHSYGGIREYCEAAGKPLVRLPGGYGTNRVAREIAEQASEALS